MEDELLNQALKPSADCPTIEQLGQLADGVLSGEARRSADAHVRGCANCQSELAMLEEFTRLSVRDDETDAVSAGVAELNRRRGEILGRSVARRPRFGRWLSPAVFRPAMTLAVVLLAIGGGYYLIQPERSRQPSAADTDALRSQAVAVVAPVGDQTTVPERFVWRAVSGAASYRVQLTEVDRQEIWSADVAVESVTLPAAIRAQIVPGKTLVWQVTAYDTAKRTVAASAPQRFRLTP